jgi:hemoglobin-like flavoprotein
MTSTQIALILEGFERIAPDAERFGLSFYDRLFASDPSVRTLFRGDIRTQAGHLMTALTLVVRSLDDLGPILESIQALGRRHARYGVQSHHFLLVGATLLIVLDDVLGATFTTETRDAWAEAYNVVADAMMTAMREPARDAA